MDLCYKCENRDCSYPGDKDYELILSLEGIMDEHNLADIFCPHCMVELRNDSRRQAA